MWALSAVVAVSAIADERIRPLEAGQAAAGRARPAGERCQRVQLEVEVAAGQTVRRQATETLDILVEARPSGWVVRVLPHLGPSPAVDWAALASPPYRSVSPLLISTDFGFRAQDAVGWNPRQFHFAADRRMAGAFEPIYRSISGTNRPRPADEAALGRLVAGSPEGTITILDARLVPGTADQGRAAAGVSSHFSETAHTLEQPGAPGQGGALGQVRALSFRISLEWPRGSRAVPAAGARSVPVACPVQ